MTGLGVAVVTGAGRGLGRAVVLALARAGFDVVVNTRTALERAAEVAREAEALGVRAAAVRADVTDGGAVEEMMRRAASLGPLRVLVNNAALRERVPLAEMTFEDWRRAHTVTLDGAFRCAQAVLPALRASGGGRIVNLLGANALRGDPERVHVSAAKHGLVGLTLALANACASEGITVNAVSPARMHADTGAERARRREQVADLVAHLALPASGGISGQVIEAGGPR
ncbi:SDR family NAD(P)-dependent oxidoreductase [Streptomyces sp. TS71-3]|uniref:SDR family NAD(P)-dependent oxidoreductase n=1 Tax=Streptomyces sp. TS71-3 TaxID=2733862 RepID=UPI001B213050|nr:SDR family NAD(P)-dependent oxidoreductase [Streptomyces sp. TS71-3]GHJ41572.1 hypothetical protein Sm713_71810 [Streptomyces sp. TS71-3]